MALPSSRQGVPVVDENLMSPKTPFRLHLSSSAVNSPRKLHTCLRHSCRRQDVYATKDTPGILFYDDTSTLSTAQHGLSCDTTHDVDDVVVWQCMHPIWLIEWMYFYLKTAWEPIKNLRIVVKQPDLEESSKIIFKAYALWYHMHKSIISTFI